MTPARRRRFVRLLALVVLLGAVLPNVTYVGHWTFRGLEHAAMNPDGHANHCHGTSACAGEAAYGLKWVTEGSDDLLLGGGHQTAADPEPPPSPSEAFIAPLDPPPQHA